MDTATAGLTEITNAIEFAQQEHPANPDEFNDVDLGGLEPEQYDPDFDPAHEPVV